MNIGIITRNLLYNKFLFLLKPRHSDLLHQLSPTPLSNLAVFQDDHLVRPDKLGHAEVVSDDDEGVFGSLHPREEFRDRAERIDIEPALDLVEYDVPGIQELHLEDLDFALLSTGEPDIEIPIQERLRNPELFRKSCQIPVTQKRRKRLGALRKIPVVDGPEVFPQSHSPHFRDILE